MNTALPALLQGKKGLIMGVANDFSLAWYIAQAASAAGAELAFTYALPQLERRVMPLAESLGSKMIYPCDVQNDEQMAEVFSKLEQAWGKLDFVIHAIAFANKDELKGGITETTRGGFDLAMQVSCYSFIHTAKLAKPLLNDGGSLLTLTYEGSQKVVPNYNIMGVAKAGLEAATRYLAAEFGPAGIRVNALSAGPVNTLAARGISDFPAMLKHHAATAPLKRLVEAEEVGKAAVYLLSSLASGVTGEVHNVDTGAHILGPTPPVSA
jgi:enoyl-[acyl-carrier protein] reductase I